MMSFSPYGLTVLTDTDILGSTVPYVVERIAQQGTAVNAKRWFVPTGFQSRELIIDAGKR